MYNQKTAYNKDIDLFSMSLLHSCMTSTNHYEFTFRDQTKVIIFFVGKNYHINILNCGHDKAGFYDKFKFFFDMISTFEDKMRFIEDIYNNTKNNI